MIVASYWVNMLIPKENTKSHRRNESFLKTNINIKYYHNLKKLYSKGITLGHLC